MQKIVSGAFCCRRLSDFHVRAGYVFGHDMRARLRGDLAIFVAQQSWSIASQRVGVYHIESHQLAIGPR